MKREKNIELIRAISCLAIVLLHFNAWSFSHEKLIGGQTQYIIINTIVRFAVPCFILITGSFVFSKASQMPIIDFYKYVLKSIIRPTMLYSLLYCVFMYMKMFFLWVLKAEEINVLEPLESWVQGIPFGHLWYMYMLIGFYIILPILVKVKKYI